MRWRLQLEEYDYEIIYRAGSRYKNADCLLRIHNVVTNDEPVSDFEEFKKAEIKPIFNSKITEIEGSTKQAQNNENIILPISNNKIMTQPAIRDLINNNNLPP